MSKYNLFNTNTSIPTGDAVYTKGGETRRSGDSLAAFDHGQTTMLIPYTGKWYQEFVLVDQRSTDPASHGVGMVMVGTGERGFQATDLRGYRITKSTTNAQYYKYSKVGQPLVGGAWSGVTGSTAVGGTFMMAYDADAGKLWYGYEGTWLDSGDPAAGTNPAESGIDNYWNWLFCAGRSTNDAGRWADFRVNSGQNGSTKFTPPTGFKTLTMDNITDAQAAVFNPTTTSTDNEGYFKALTYTGNSSSGDNAINVGFQPDLVILKSRTQAYDWVLIDSLNGSGKVNYPSASATEGDKSSEFTFTSTGFTLNTTGGNDINEGGQGSDNMLAYCWKIGGSSQVLTTGDIDTTVLANQDTGMSIIRWSGNQTQSNIPHGLSRKPDAVILKNYSLGSAWFVGGKVINQEAEQASLANYNNSYLTLSSNAGIDAATTGFTGMTDEFIQVNTDTSFNGNGTNNMVAFCFHSVPGFSQIGWYYSGVGQADGPFINCGFEPAMVLIKGNAVNRNWQSWDNARFSSVNPRYHHMRWDINSTEGNDSANMDIDFLSNGFKIRGQSGEINTSSEYYWYMAFGKDAFKYGNAVGLLSE